MSIQAYRWAMAQRDLSPSEKFTLVVIADRFNVGWHRAWPSQATLAADTCLSERTVARSVRTLAQRGLISVEPWMNGDTEERLNNRYLLPLFDGSAPAQVQPVRAYSFIGGDFPPEPRRVPGSNLFIEGGALE